MMKQNRSFLKGIQRLAGEGAPGVKALLRDTQEGRPWGALPLTRTQPYCLWLCGHHQCPFAAWSSSAPALGSLLLD